MDLELKTTDGKSVDIEAAELKFAQANLAAPEQDVPAPPKMTEEQKETIKSEPAKRRGRPHKAERARTQSKAQIAPQSDTERADGIKGLVQLGAGLCLIADQRTPETDISFQADAITLASSADEIANAVVATCKASDSFARAVDKVTKAGPYAALVGVVFSVGAQIARNHGVKAAEMMGAVAPEALIAAMQDGAN